MWSWNLNAILLICVALVVGGCRPSPPTDEPAGDELTSPEIELPADEPASAADEAPAADQSTDREDASQAMMVSDTVFVPEPTVEANEMEVGATAEVVLGTPDLTAGIPGTGPVTNSELVAWLDDPANHAVLSVELPMGLAAAAANITGIDENPLTRAKIELGRQLYFDPRLSSDGTISCASCHDPEEGYSAHTQFGVGVGGQQGNRNSPVSYNRIVSGPQFWDGRASSLEDQAVGPIANAIEMANTHETCVETLGNIEGYKLQFDRIFPAGLTIDTVGMAIAAFERVIVTGPTMYDYLEVVNNVERAYDAEELQYLEEDDPDLFARYTAAKQATANVHESVIRGRDLFFSEKSNCTACHAGANFTDEKYHNLGVGMDSEEPDLGRFVVTENPVDRGAFKTPTIRNVALSAPYMHDGSQATLEEVVEWYAKGGHPNDHLSDKVKKLDLTGQDKADLVAFMKDGLTGSFPPIERQRLPE